MHYSGSKNHSKLRTVGVQRVGSTDAVMSYFNSPSSLSTQTRPSPACLINFHFLNQNQKLLSCTRPYARAAQKAATRRRLSLPSSSPHPPNGVGEPLTIPQCSQCRCLPPTPQCEKERMCANQAKQNHEKLFETQKQHMTCELDSNADLFDG
jgi:hypothetical protein